jgi:hypothetical protein
VGFLVCASLEETKSQPPQLSGSPSESRTQEVKTLALAAHKGACYFRLLKIYQAQRERSKRINLPLTGRDED